MLQIHKYKKDITYCAFCPKLCGFSCPVAQFTTSETYSPTGKMNLLYLAQNNTLRPNKEFSEVIFYGCSGCLVCKEYCKWKIDIPQIIQHTREIITKDNIMPQEVSSLLENINNFKNPYGKYLHEKLKEIVSSYYFERNDEILYFPGCKTIEYFPENIKDTIKFFEKFNIKFRLLNKTMCCGIINLKLGDFEGYNFLKNGLKKELHNFKKIICSCPECAYIFHKKYKIKNVFHISEFIDQIFPKSHLCFTEDKISVMYSDPCYLTRYLNVIDEPRNILSQICNAKIIDFLWSKERAGCCGGILGLIKPDMAQNIAKAKIKEAKNKKQTIIITSCPQCQHILGSNQDEIKVKDIVSFVIERTYPSYS